MRPIALTFQASVSFIKISSEKHVIIKNFVSQKDNELLLLSLLGIT